MTGIIVREQCPFAAYSTYVRSGITVRQNVPFLVQKIPGHGFLCASDSELTVCTKGRPVLYDRFLSLMASLTSLDWSSEVFVTKSWSKLCHQWHERVIHHACASYYSAVKVLFLNSIYIWKQNRNPCLYLRRYIENFNSYFHPGSCHKACTHIGISASCSIWSVVLWLHSRLAVYFIVRK